MAFSQFKMSALPYAQEAREQIHFCGEFSKTKQPNFPLIPVKLASGLQFMRHRLEDVLQRAMLEIPTALRSLLQPCPFCLPASAELTKY